MPFPSLVSQLDQPEPIGMRRVDLFGVAGVVAIHAEWRHQNGAVDADGVHGCHHLVAGDLGRADERPEPGPVRMVAFVGMHLGVDGQHDFGLSDGAVAGKNLWDPTHRNESNRAGPA